MAEGMPSISRSQCWPKPSPCPGGETQAQKRKKDVLKATQAVTDRAPMPASLTPPWALVYVI